MNRQAIRSFLSVALVFTSISLPGRTASAQDQTPPAIEPQAPTQPEAVQAEGNIAYVYKADVATANDYKTFLASNGYNVTLVPVSNTLNTNFNQFDVTMVGDDTGDQAQWGTAAGQAAYIAKNSQVMGIGEGGYAFFGQLQMKIGYPNGAHGNYRGVKGDALSDMFNIPNDLSAMASVLAIYTNNINTVGIYISPTAPSGTEVLGTLAPHDRPDYAPLIAEGCHQLWGFSGRPSGMNPNGKRLLLNALSHLQGQCASALKTCAIVKSQTAIPAPGVIDFDDVASNTAISQTYKAQFGVNFGNSIRTFSTTTAHSQPNVGYNPPGSIAAPPPFTASFDTPKTHVGFYMGGSATLSNTGTLIAFDANGKEICRTSKTGATGHTTFIGLYDAQQRIASIAFVNSNGQLNETMDDLTFAPYRPIRLSFPVPDLPHFNPKDDITTDILNSDNKIFNASFTLPKMQLGEILAGDGSVRVQAAMPGVDLFSNPPGLPDVPILRRVVAVPEGASLKIRGITITPDSSLNVALYPAQPSAEDSTYVKNPFAVDVDPFADKPYVISTTAYAQNALYPAEPVTVTKLGKMRDLNLWQIEMATGQYNPKTGLLNLFKSVGFEMEFDGGNGGFLPKQEATDPFEKHFDGVYSQVVNQAVIGNHLWDKVIFPNICIGSEYLIITHPDYKAAADTLKTWKVQKGISTQVVETGAGAGQAGTTKEQIQAFIRNRYNTCLIRPSYLLLLGDSEDIPVWSSGADLEYSLMDNADSLPDLAYGRMPVDTLTEANRVVNKVIAFEKTPPFNAAFYKNFTFASYFECCRSGVAVGTDGRSFVETAELVRNALQAKGKTVERIYNTNTDHEAYAGDATPRKYYNGALLPVDLRAGSGFAWNGNTTNIVNAINAGRMLVFHRDHGGPNGWENPGFGTGNLGSLTNGALTPVVYSVNCASGQFDNEPTNNWAESFLRLDGGAVGIIGDTRNSPTWENSALARGLFDATWTNVLPSYGSSTKIRRLGDILNYAKLYLVSQIGVAQTAGDISNSDAMTDVRLYHVFGDPTMELWTGDPHGFVLPGTVFTAVLSSGLKLTYPVSLTEITALQNGLPVGRGITDISGTVNIEYFVTPTPGQPVQLSASTSGDSDEAVSVLLGEVEVKRLTFLPFVVKQ